MVHLLLLSIFPTLLSNLHVAEHLQILLIPHFALSPFFQSCEFPPLQLQQIIKSSLVGLLWSLRPSEGISSENTFLLASSEVPEDIDSPLELSHLVREVGLSSANSLPYAQLALLYLRAAEPVYLSAFCSSWELLPGLSWASSSWARLSLLKMFWRSCSLLRPRNFDIIGYKITPPARCPWARGGQRCAAEAGCSSAWRGTRWPSLPRSRRELRTARKPWS